MAMNSWPEKEFRKLDNPQPDPGCYDLHLYCDHENPDHEFDEFPHQFGHGCETGSQARAQAKKTGWKVHKDGTATCPKCVKRLRIKKEVDYNFKSFHNGWIR